MTYWFDGRVLTLSGRPAGAVLGHDPAPGDGHASRTRASWCSMCRWRCSWSFPTLSALRAAIFRGAVIEALDIKPYDRDMFLRWREDLLPGDAQLEQIVKDELTARIRRLDREGWHDLREVAPAGRRPAHLGHDHDRALQGREDGAVHRRACAGGHLGRRRGEGRGPSPQLCDVAVQAGDRAHHQAVDHAAPARHRAVAC